LSIAEDMIRIIIRELLQRIEQT